MLSGMLHAAAMLLMIGSAITAAGCCLVAGRLAPRDVPWQARQSAVVMAAGMVALAAAEDDARAALLVAVAGLASAMLGVVGTRGRPHAAACFHRALGCVVMAVCALALLGASLRAGVAVRSGGVTAGVHAGHGVVVPFALVAVAGVVGLLVLMLAARVRHGSGVDAPGRHGALLRVVRRRRAVSAAEAGTGSGRILLAAEGVAMAVSLAVMGAMVLAL
ncbi:hypothetical protein SAMN04488593_3289 [Microbacterium azadirachtae]|nr:hypothetical protein SAMN04488593_3289 [Microbacterium azadirachtae]SEG45807.1 hypothetical protein SAMN04488594_2991 [Microbacterium azadirachtae]SEG53779.1 hypothetical protein SAMN04488592_3284 [Microbacterium azadirachtae]